MRRWFGQKHFWNSFPWKPRSLWFGLVFLVGLVVWFFFFN